MAGRVCLTPAPAGSSSTGRGPRLHRSFIPPAPSWQALRGQAQRQAPDPPSEASRGAGVGGDGAEGAEAVSLRRGVRETQASSGPPEEPQGPRRSRRTSLRQPGCRGSETRGRKPLLPQGPERPPRRPPLPPGNKPTPSLRSWPPSRKQAGGCRWRAREGGCPSTFPPGLPAGGAGAESRGGWFLPPKEREACVPQAPSRPVGGDTGSTGGGHGRWACRLQSHPGGRAGRHVSRTVVCPGLPSQRSGAT